jgi:hypothetical protein
MNAMTPAEGQAMQIKPQTITERLDHQIQEHTERLVKLQRLKELLMENPVQREVLSLQQELGLGHSF